MTALVKTALRTKLFEVHAMRPVWIKIQKATRFLFYQSQERLLLFIKVERAVESCLCTGSGRCADVET